MHTKKFIAIALTLILAFASTACGNSVHTGGANTASSAPLSTLSVPPTPENTPKPTEEPTPTPSQEPTPAPTPTPGPLTAAFIALLVDRNYYIKLECAQVFTGDAENGIEIMPIPSDWAIQWHRVETARQDDMYAWVRRFTTDKANEPSQHTIDKGYKKYGISHMFKEINVWEKTTSSADDSGDFFPVSRMYFIESGMGSVNGVTMPYETYAMTDRTTVWRFYVNGDKVVYCMRIKNDGVVIDVFSLMETSRNIPSHMFALPANYPFDYIVFDDIDDADVPPETPAPQG